MTIDALHIGLALFGVLCALGWAGSLGYSAGIQDARDAARQTHSEEGK